MSHFLMVVLLPPDTPRDEQIVDAQVTQRIAPYNENMEVEPYPQECWCIGSVARKDAREAAIAAHGTFENLRASFGPLVADLHVENFADLPEEERIRIWDERERRWKEHIAPWVAVEQAALEAHPLLHSPHPECDECEGTGTYQSTYNPNSKWDWWRIGGRYDGVMLKLPEMPDRTGAGFNFEEKFETVARNAGIVKEVLARNPEFVAFGLVTPDGEWHERGQMGWWGVVHDEKDRDEWGETFRTKLAEFPEHLAVTIDCHI